MTEKHEKEKKKSFDMNTYLNFSFENRKLSKLSYDCHEYF